MNRPSLPFDSFVAAARINIRPSPNEASLETAVCVPKRWKGVRLEEVECLRQDLAAILQVYMQNGKKEAFGYGEGDERGYLAPGVTAPPACSS